MFNDDGSKKKSDAIIIIPAISSFIDGLITLAKAKYENKIIAAHARRQFTMNDILQSSNLLGFKIPIIDNEGNNNKTRNIASSSLAMDRCELRNSTANKIKMNRFIITAINCEAE